MPNKDQFKLRRKENLMLYGIGLGIIAVFTYASIKLGPVTLNAIANIGFDEDSAKSIEQVKIRNGDILKVGEEGTFQVCAERRIYAGAKVTNIEEDKHGKQKVTIQTLEGTQRQTSPIDLSINDVLNPIKCIIPPKSE